MIWVIDDDEIYQYTFAKKLKKAGCREEVRSFNSALEALQLIKQTMDSELPSTILLDINMPEMDGWEFLEEIKSIELNNMKIFMVSSSVNRVDKERAKQHSSIYGYFSKPLNFEELLNNI